LQSVHLETTEAVGKIVKARIVSVMTNSLGGLQIAAA
jgi:hypothetical protein